MSRQTHAGLCGSTSPYFKGDLVDRAGEASVRADADALGDRCLIVDADVGRLVRREDIGLSLLDPPLGDGLSVHVEGRLATLAGSAAVIGEVEGDRRGTGRQGFGCGDGVALQPEEVVGVGRLAVLHVQRPAAEATALRQDRAVGAIGRNLELGGDLARAVLHVHEGVFHHALHPLVEREGRAITQDIRPAGDGRVRALDGPVVDRQHVVPLELPS